MMTGRILKLHYVVTMQKHNPSKKMSKDMQNLGPLVSHALEAPE